MIIPCFIGYMEIVIILLILLLLFGGRKIPELMRGLGRGIKEFKNESKPDDETPADNPTPGKKKQ